MRLFVSAAKRVHLYHFIHSIPGTDIFSPADKVSWAIESVLYVCMYVCNICFSHFLSYGCIDIRENLHVH